MSLEKFYKNPKEPASFGGINALRRAVGKQVKTKDIKQWLETKDSYTLHKPARRNFKKNRVIVGGCLASYRLVGRWNRVLKDNLHHVIRETPSNWDKQLPYLLFACREMPNSPTDVSPFKLLYGRYARGPLAILKSHGQEKCIYRQLVAQSAADYLQTIKICNEKVAEQAVLTTAH
ncbi:reverse transcriptase [Caerostris darwini]|uniref:Reverse transcriptase n=1 Tax=Caerostris darwini TaxID=1538125 RepID=A0AAV4SIL7_9ARAC|nr:reverse transcriptase [Caerostris darwini]